MYHLTPLLQYLCVRWKHVMDTNTNKHKYFWFQNKKSGETMVKNGIGNMFVSLLFIFSSVKFCKIATKK